MKLLDLTLDQPSQNLALDEALVEIAEQVEHPREVLRLWEPASSMVVIGRASRNEDEVHRDRCDELGIPILRRTSGGAAIVTGPGCLMYAVVLSYELRPALRSIDEAHCFVLGIVARAVRSLIEGVRMAGTSDLALGSRKFSGNSLRCKRSHLLYHGTLLYDFPLDLISQCLRTPPRLPAYREGREHDQFITNLPVSRDELRDAMINAWDARIEQTDWPQDLTRQLDRTRYSQQSWNFSR